MLSISKASPQYSHTANQMLPAEVGEKMVSRHKHGKTANELEAYWYGRVRQAHRRYADALERHRALAAEMTRRSIVEPDGSFVVAKARRAEAWARHEFARVTHIYSDLVARGITPPKDDDEELIG